MKALAGVELAGDAVYTDVVTAEKAAIVSTNAPTRRGSLAGVAADRLRQLGPYVVELLKRMGLCSGARLASGADNIISLMQSGSLLMGTPFLNVWEEPGPNGMVDGNGSAATLQSQLAQGIAGGHETLVSSS